MNAEILLRKGPIVKRWLVHLGSGELSPIKWSPMTVIETTLATGPRVSSPPNPPRLSEVAWFCVARLLKLVLPAANPDFERAYENVLRWWVDIDAAGVPQRELGFDASGKAIVAGPIGENRGFWTDSNMVFDIAKYKALSSDEFELAWSAFVASHPAIAGEDEPNKTANF